MTGLARFRTAKTTESLFPDLPDLSINRPFPHRDYAHAQSPKLTQLKDSEIEMSWTRTSNRRQERPHRLRFEPFERRSRLADAFHTNPFEDVQGTPGDMSWRFQGEGGQPTKPIAKDTALTSVFVCYSHRDRKHLERLQVHLEPLAKTLRIDAWDDTRIAPGSRWRNEIASAIEAANIAVLLVSADFLASTFIVEDELPPLLKGARERGTTILPVIHGFCRFLQTPELSIYQSANDPVRPLDMLPSPNREKVWFQVSECVEGVID